MFSTPSRRDRRGTARLDGTLVSRRPRLMVLIAAVMVGVIFLPTAPASSQLRPRISGIQNVTPITEVLPFGQKVTAVAVEYPYNVSWRNLDLDSFTVSDSLYNFRFNPIADLTDPTKRADRTVTAVYTNDSPDVREDQQSVPGKWVIVELDWADPAGSTVVAFAGGVRVNPDLQTKIVQNVDISRLVDSGRNTGSVIAEASSEQHGPTTPAVNLIADDFVYERRTTAAGTMIPYAYWLPEDYDPAKSYPMVVILPGNGQGYIPQASTGLDNEGVQVASDNPAVAWTQPEITGTDEDVIVLAPQNQRIGGTAGQMAAMVDLINWFGTQYSVDQDRIYTSTVSFGSTLAWATLVAHPGLFDAALITGGFGASVAQATAIAATGVPIWVTHGTTDHLLNVVTTGQASYNRIWAAYTALGLTPAQANAKIKYTEYGDEAFFEPDEHLASAPTYEDQKLLQWLLAQ